MEITVNPNKLVLYFASMLFALTLSCGVSPGRKILAKGCFEPNVSIGTFLSGAQYAASPVIPNLELGLGYGLTDRISIGGSWAVLPILTKEIIFAGNPYIVGQVLPAYSMWPSINLYGSLPFFIPLKMGGLKVVPLVGGVIRKEWGRFGMYPVVECSFDSDVFQNKLDVHTNARIGFDWITLKKTSFTLEFGIDDIGYRNYGGNLTYGYPCINIGISHAFFKKQKMAVNQ
jgi:hypothetical protein